MARILVALAIIVLGICAALSAHQHKPFLTPAIDAGPGVLPAQASEAPALLVAPCQVGPQNLPIASPERTA